MAEQTHSEQYERVRRDFEGMNVQDRAVFLLEATVSTIARGVEQAGRVLADEMDKAFRWRPEPAEEGAESGSASGGESTKGPRRRPSTGGTSPEGHVET
jgi:hypothetical protein